MVETETWTPDEIRSFAERMVADKSNRNQILNEEFMVRHGATKQLVELHQLYIALNRSGSD